MRFVFLVSGCMLAASALAAPQATPGQWSITATMHMDGKMKMDMPPTTVKICLKPEDVKDPAKQGFMGGPNGQMNPDCKKVDTSFSGNTMKFHMRCEGKHASDISGEVTYGNDSYQGRTVIDAETGQGKMHMTNEFTAKRLGDC
ncbi:DUF3617 domain-containing protein [Chitinimonas sp.]|uniref:DUF3617 domain-containing protein n=1 Tax=Chitinimonas sp. TaxID=1934313 RepID=UPI0035B2631C